MNRWIAGLAVLGTLGTLACGSDGGTAPLSIDDPKGLWTGTYGDPTVDPHGKLVVLLKRDFAPGVIVGSEFAASDWVAYLSSGRFDVSRSVDSGNGPSVGAYSLTCTLSDAHTCDGTIQFTPLDHPTTVAIHLTR